MGLQEEIISRSLLSQSRGPGLACAFLGTALEVWNMKKASSLGRGRGAGGTGQCHHETSLKHLGRARDIREVLRCSEKASIIFKTGKKEDWECYRLVSFTSVPGKVTGQMLLQPSPSLEGQEKDC